MTKNAACTKVKKKTAKKPRPYKEALDLAEAGKHEEALVCIQEYLASSPTDPEALNDTGTILFSLGHTEEAINHLAKARQLYPDAHEILWNLSEVYLADQKPQQAIELFDEMQKMGILNPDVLNRTADCCLKNDNLPDALTMLERSLEMLPDQDILRPMVKIIKTKMAENPCS